MGFLITEQTIKKLKSNDPAYYSIVIGCSDGTDLILTTLKKSQNFYKETKTKGFCCGFILSTMIYAGMKAIKKVKENEDA